MTKLDWKNHKDYEYTDKLGSAGWAWEFLRRSDAYRTEYERGDQTQAMRWNLKKLYQPDEAYHSGIEFKYKNQFPLYFSSPTADWDHLSIDQLELFPEIRPVEEMANLTVYSDMVFVVFDASIPLKQQMDKTKDLLERYQDGRPFSRKDETKVHKDKLQRQLRMLDAFSSPDKPKSQTEAIKIIYPDKKWTSLSDDKQDQNKKDTGYDLASPEQITKFASDVFKEAKYMAEEGYQKFLMRLSQGI